MIIMNRECPDACVGTTTPNVAGDIPTILIGRAAGFAMFDIPFDLHSPVFYWMLCEW